MTISPLHLSRRSLLIGSAALAATYRYGMVQSTEPGDTIDFPARLGTLFGAVPARDLTIDAGIPFYYADLAGQLAAAEIPRPRPDASVTAVPEGFAEATLSLPLASRAFQSGRVPEWFETFGFSPLAIGQALDVATHPDTLSVFAGGFERDRVEAALEASGYAWVEQETGGSYWTVGDELDLTSTVSRLGVGAMNNAVVDDDLLIFTPRQTDIQQVTQVRAGLQPSMLEQGIWSGMLPVFSPDVVGLIPVAPELLTQEPLGLSDATPAATPVGEEENGLPLEYIAFGVRAGARSERLSLVGEGTPVATMEDTESVAARIEVRIRYADAGLAEHEAVAIPERWESAESMFTGQPFTDLMTFEEARISSVDPQVLELDFTASTPNVWIQMVHSVDLLPLLPAEG